MTGIQTRVAHPESNGRLEYYRTLEAMARWSDNYNYEWPPLALHYLRPVDYYRGDPAARLAEREQKLAEASEPWRQYWQAYANVKELPELSLPSGQSNEPIP